MIAAPTARSPPTDRKTGKGGRQSGGKSGQARVWIKPRRRPSHKLRLAAAKRAQMQNLALSGEAAGDPLTTGAAAVVDLSWPEAMRLERVHCRSIVDRNAWAERWAEVLSGRVRDRELNAAQSGRPRQHSLHLYRRYAILDRS